MAVNCTDLPQLFSRSASPNRRRLQLEIALRTAPDAFQPFTPREWLTISGYSQPYDVCLDWPRPVHHLPAIPPGAKPLGQDVPILILGGDLDSLTPLSDAPDFAPKLGANVRIVTLANTVHVTSEGDTPLVAGKVCARAVIRSFLRGRLAAGCAPGIPAIHTPDFTAADPATIAVNTAVDATIRLFYSGAGHGPGLRGGTFTFHKGTITFHNVRFTPDAPVSGSVKWNSSTGTLAGTLKVAGTSVRIDWSQSAPTATAVTAGATLQVPAP